MLLLSLLITWVTASRGANTIADLDRLQHDLSKFLSVPRYNETEKQVTRNAIKIALEAVGLPSMTHTFIHEETNEIGANVIAVQKSDLFGTSEDRIIVLTANYDTLENSPGVDDNGSGVAAVIEAARILSTLDSLYLRKYTILYAFFDMKHKALAGSHAFVEDVLIPLLGRCNCSVTGAVVVDGMLHFDPFPASQAVPEGFEEDFPEAARLLHEHSHMGDFIQVTSRTHIDDGVFQQYSMAYSMATEMLVSDWQFQPWLLPVKLHIRNASSINGLYKMHPYLFADHSSFFFHSQQDLDIPTIYVSDTLSRRGVRQYCPYCDGLYMMTAQNMKFLALLTDSLIRFLVASSQSEALAVVDELYTFVFNIDV
ncbi:unnamed protein product [Caenorhabditis auriculariae]|uniref:Peptidase M28 domain-containing protein n=1 Tax=Caenorhabditis auriculariae TaxID=2777116 RepID=A0A8S1GY70_9PELO|nr:unnamed protein product [Caenorhabditis auriculariae]